VFYIVVTIVAFCAMQWAEDRLPAWALLILNTVLILLFTALVVKRDLPLSSLPVIGKKFKKQ